MFDLNKFNITKTKDTRSFGIYKLGPFSRGYGHSFANMLRRALYSSVSGAAITSVKVNGVYHEYTALTGVADDVLMMLLNLKQIVFVLNSDKPVKLTLNKKGIGDVLAEDFEESSSVDILNPDFQITSLNSDKAKLEIEITIENGVSYSKSDENKRSEVGLIPIDSDFCPVKLVKMDVTDTRVGNVSDLEEITLEVTTNGAVSAYDALKEAAEQINVVSTHLVEIMHGKVVEVKRDFDAAIIKKVDLTIDKLNITTRLYNCLDKMGIKALTELAGKSRKEISDIKGLGEKSKKELLKVLEKYEIEIID